MRFEFDLIVIHVLQAVNYNFPPDHLITQKLGDFTKNCLHRNTFVHKAKPPSSTNCKWLGQLHTRNQTFESYGMTKEGTILPSIHLFSILSRV